MLIIEHTEKTHASKEMIWSIWEDVENWNSWDHGLEFSTLDGPFKTGTTGTLKPKGGPVIKTTLTKVDPMNAFVDEAKLPLTTILMYHKIEEGNDNLKITNRVEMYGFFAPFYAILLGRDLKKNLPTEMRAMIKKAESM